VARDGWSPDRLESRLRRGDPPVIARIVGDRVALDLRTVPPEDEAELVEGFRRAASEE
jgi:L-seryl-tRNA(Ser) seleniumtransferase